LEQCFLKVREVSPGSWLTAALHHSKQLNWLIVKLHAVRESCEKDTAADRIRLAVQRTGTLAWELDVIRTHGLDRKLDLAIETIELASTEAGKIVLKGRLGRPHAFGLAVGRARAFARRQSRLLSLVEHVDATRTAPGLNLSSTVVDAPWALGRCIDGAEHTPRQSTRVGAARNQLIE
jgi:hypothetical protein